MRRHRVSCLGLCDLIDVQYIYVYIYMLDSDACHAHWGGGVVCVLATFLLSFVSLTARPGRLSARQSKALDLLAFVA